MGGRRKKVLSHEEPGKEEHEQLEELLLSEERRQEDMDPVLNDLDIEIQSRFGEIIWARISGFSHWPAVICNPTQVPLVLQEKAFQQLKTHFVVYFFSSDKYAPVQFSSIVPWSEGTEDFFQGVRKKGKRKIKPGIKALEDLNKAIALAEQQLKLRGGKKEVQEKKIKASITASSSSAKRKRGKKNEEEPSIKAKEEEDNEPKKKKGRTNKKKEAVVTTSSAMAVEGEDESAMSSKKIGRPRNKKEAAVSTPSALAAESDDGSTKSTKKIGRPRKKKEAVVTTSSAMTVEGEDESAMISKKKGQASKKKEAAVSTQDDKNDNLASLAKKTGKRRRDSIELSDSKDNTTTQLTKAIMSLTESKFNDSYENSNKMDFLAKLENKVKDLERQIALEIDGNKAELEAKFERYKTKLTKVENELLEG